MASISVIIVSELGDKTFFIAAIMAMRYNRLTVLVGAMLALGLMTCLSGELWLMLGSDYVFIMNVERSSLPFGNIEFA